MSIFWAFTNRQMTKIMKDEPCHPHLCLLHLFSFTIIPSRIFANYEKLFLSCGCFECLELPSYSSLAQMFKNCLSHARPAICIILDVAWGEHIPSSIAPRCLWSSENDVQLGCLSRSWEMKGWHRYRTRWHCTLGIIFSDKLGLGLWILAFACSSHSH